MNSNLKILFCEQNPLIIQGCQHFFADKDVQLQFCEKDGNTLGTSGGNANVEFGGPGAK